MLVFSVQIKTVAFDASKLTNRNVINGLSILQNEKAQLPVLDRDMLFFLFEATMNFARPMNAHLHMHACISTPKKITSYKLFIAMVYSSVI